MNDVLVQTENTKFADQLLHNVEHQAEGSIVMIYGFPGTGKTFYVKKKTFSNGWIYQCITACEHLKTFLEEVYKRLYRHIHGVEMVPRGNTARLQSECNELFKHPKASNAVFVFDEINLLIQFRKWQILEVIRQFRDIAGATIVLVGEHDTRGKITAYNDHYFSRCKFVEFAPVSMADLIRIVKSRSDMDIDDNVVKYLISNEVDDEKIGRKVNKCHGSVRIATDRLEILEQEAKRLAKASIIFDEVKGVTYAAN